MEKMSTNSNGNNASGVFFANELRGGGDFMDALDSKVRNFTVLVTETDPTDPEYEQFLADVWVGIVLTLMVLSCVCCMCSCLLYHKFQQWKRGVLESRNAAAMEIGESESLPSYTVVSGLPSYEEALEQLKKVQELTRNNKPVDVHGHLQSNATNSCSTTAVVDNSNSNWIPRTPPTVSKLSVADLLQIYKANAAISAGSTSVEATVLQKV